jgi:hypothetical protein
MIQPGGSAGFKLKTIHRIAIAGQPLTEKFDGDSAAQADVHRTIDFSHAATAQLLQNAVMSDGLAGQGHLTLKIKGW